MSPDPDPRPSPPAGPDDDGPAVVVGGGSGIGRATADRMRDRGRAVVTWDLAGADIDCDIADDDQVAAATVATLDAVGAPSSLTVTAGTGHAGYLSDVDRAQWEAVLGVNTVGVWSVMRSLRGPMVEGGGGSIVAVGSVSGRLVDKAMGVYCVSKAALDMLVRVAALEWAPELRVNAVAPGVTDTPILGPVPRDGEWLGGVARRTPMRRLGTAEDLAEAIVAVHSMTWMTGQVVEVDGGLGLFSPIRGR